MASERLEEPPAPADPGEKARPGGILSVRNFAAFSIVHSVFFTGLVVCAFFLEKPQPATFFFGFAHGVMYMAMTAACIVAARRRIVSVTMALVVVIVGLFGPYFGAYEFVREERRLRSGRPPGETAGHPEAPPGV